MITKHIVVVHGFNISQAKFILIMIAILDIPEKEIKLEFDNLTCDQFRMIGSKPNDKIPAILEFYTTGRVITLITSNMPEPLKDEITKLISQYCGH